MLIHSVLIEIKIYFLFPFPIHVLVVFFKPSNFATRKPKWQSPVVSSFCRAVRFSL